MTEEELLARLPGHSHELGLKMMLELLAIRRNRHRDSLEKNENPEIRGRAKECKDILTFFG